MRLALRMHPDKAHQNAMCNLAARQAEHWLASEIFMKLLLNRGPEEATKRFQLIQEAYSASSPDSRCTFLYFKLGLPHA